MKNFLHIKKQNFLSFLLFFTTVLIAFSFQFPCLKSYADTEDNSKEIYIIYNQTGEIIYEGNKVIVGDKIITNRLKEYEVYKVDDLNQIAYAEYNGQYIKPNITKKSKELNFSNSSTKKSVGLYMTHNDESYIPSDNTSSFYGKGGIHDVAQAIKSNFEKQNYTVYLNETLHLPHDSGAYGRSYSTAKSLLEKDVDALFDIHRDGVARSVYVKEIDGVERCKVRIVVGQANPNKDANLQFAMYLVSVAEEYCPWLFLDIYYAKGHYNQALTSKGLLFEMGTYLAEKELVLETVPYLTKVIDKTLFSTVVDEDNNLTITDTPTEDQQQNIVNNVLNTKTSINSFWSKHSNNVIVFCFLFISILLICLYFIFKYNKRKNYYKKKN